MSSRWDDAPSVKFPGLTPSLEPGYVGGGGLAAGVAGRRPSPEYELERLYALDLTTAEAALVLSFFAGHYPLSMSLQLDEIVRTRRLSNRGVASPPFATSDALSTPV